MNQSQINQKLKSIESDYDREISGIFAEWVETQPKQFDPELFKKENKKELTKARKRYLSKVDYWEDGGVKQTNRKRKENAEAAGREFVPVTIEQLEETRKERKKKKEPQAPPAPPEPTAPEAPQEPTESGGGGPGAGGPETFEYEEGMYWTVLPDVRNDLKAAYQSGLDVELYINGVFVSSLLYEMLAAIVSLQSQCAAQVDKHRKPADATNKQQDYVNVSANSEFSPGAVVFNITADI